MPLSAICLNLTMQLNKHDMTFPLYNFFRIVRYPFHLRYSSNIVNYYKVSLPCLEKVVTCQNVRLILLHLLLLLLFVQGTSTSLSVCDPFSVQKDITRWLWDSQGVTLLIYRINSLSFRWVASGVVEDESAAASTPDRRSSSWGRRPFGELSRKLLVSDKDEAVLLRPN